MTLRGLHIFGLALVWVAAPSLAQSQLEKRPGSHVIQPRPAVQPSDARLSDVDAARLMVRAFADCLFLRQQSQVLKFASLKVDDPASGKLYSGLADERCLRADGSFRIPGSVARGAIFRTLYVNKFKGIPGTLAPQPVDFGSFVIDPSSANSLEYLALMDFAQCVVREDMANSVKFIRAYPASNAEQEALDGLTPKLGPCLAEGSKFVINKPNLEALLSEAIYREADIAVSVGTKPEARN